MEALENKDKGQSALLEAVKAKLKEYRSEGMKVKRKDGTYKPR